MNAERQMADLLEGWFEDEPRERPDRDEVVRSVLMRVHSTAQGRHRWWPFRRRAGRASDVPSLTAATSEGSTSVVGRVQPTFSATRFVVAGVVVALLGGILASGVLTQQAPGVPGAATGDAGTFSPTGSLAQPRSNHSATLLPDGRVLIVGGDVVGDQGTTTAEVWDPGTGAFSPTGSLAEARSTPSATLLPDGRVLIVGGGSDDDFPSAEVWDPVTGAFSPAGSPAMDWIDSATLLADGRVLVTGGVDTVDRGADGSEESLPTAEVWDPATSTFSPTGMVFGGDDLDPPRPYPFIEATLLADGRVLITEDATDEGSTGSVRVWDPVADTFGPAGPGASTMESYGATTLLSDGRVLIFGTPYPCNEGWDAFCIKSAEVWDPATGTFSPAGSLPRKDSGPGRAFYTVTALPDGRVLITGGCSYFNVCADYFPTGEVWDPDTETFGPAGDMGVTRGYHTATLLDDGRVLVVGGFEDNYYSIHLASAEIWEPSGG